MKASTGHAGSQMGPKASGEHPVLHSRGPPEARALLPGSSCACGRLGLENRKNGKKGWMRLDPDGQEES